MNDFQKKLTCFFGSGRHPLPPVVVLGPAGDDDGEEMEVRKPHKLPPLPQPNAQLSSRVSQLQQHPGQLPPGSLGHPDVCPPPTRDFFSLGPLPQSPGDPTGGLGGGWDIFFRQ